MSTYIPNDTTIKKDTLNKRDLSRLIDYYRTKFESMETERLDWLKKIEDISLNLEEKHKMEWELKKRAEEIQDLQDALKKQSLGIHEERKQIFGLTSEIERIKCSIKFNNFLVKSDEDRKRLVQLLQLAEPIEQTVKLYHDRRPEKTEKYANNNYDPGSLSLNKAQKSGKTTTSSNCLKTTLEKSNKTGNKLTHHHSTNSLTKMSKSQAQAKFKSENGFYPLEYR